MIEMICSGDLYELVSFEADDADEKEKNKEGKEGKETKEKEEKSEYSKNSTLYSKSELAIFYIESHTLFSFNKFFISEKFVFTPEQPPEV
jgi:hypothetical protein